MTVVSNTSPLRYLVGAGYENLLRDLFGQIIVPPGVVAELSDPGAPVHVRIWVGAPPGWVQVRATVSPPDSELLKALDRGESEAIQLALELRADALIIDEWKGRSLAQSRGLAVTGALGVLGQSWQRGLIEDPLVRLEVLRSLGFRISASLIETFAVLLDTAYSRDSTALRSASERR